jgi:hypothetical protein
MHYVTCICDQMPKHKFGVTCPDTFFVESIPVPPEYDKNCITISPPGHTGINYVTHRSHQTQKHKFSVACPIALFVESIPLPPEHEK